MTSNGVRGIKLHYYQLDDLGRVLMPEGGAGSRAVAHALVRTFPDLRLIHLVRRDKPRQAISYVRACQTGVWFSLEAGPRGRRDEAPRADFDFRATARFEQILRASEQAWRRFFADCGLEPLVVGYEELVADYSGTIRRILRWLEIPGARELPIPPSRFKRQADALTEEWLVRYEASRATDASGDSLVPESGSSVPAEDGRR